LEQHFSVSTRVRGCFQIVVVQGDLDAAPAAELGDAIDGCQDGRPVIIDLSGVDFMSSAGLDVLLRDRRAGTALVCPPGNVTRLFEVVRTNRRVPIFKDLDSAIQSIALGRNVQPRAPTRKTSQEGTRKLGHAREATQPPAYV
jgi:anti-anti-sigma factor